MTRTLVHPTIMAHRRAPLLQVTCRPITGHEGPEGEYPFISLDTRWGVGGHRHAPAALPPGKRPGTHCNSPPPGFDLRTFQPVASRYTDCAIPTTKSFVTL